MEIGESRQRASLLDKIDRRQITRDRGSPRGSRLVRVMSLLGSDSDVEARNSDVCFMRR
jgi:hypothetical protein